MWRQMDRLRGLVEERSMFMDRIALSFPTARYIDDLLSTLPVSHAIPRVDSSLESLARRPIMGLLDSQWSTWRTTMNAGVGVGPILETMYSEISEDISRIVSLQSGMLYQENYALAATIGAWHQSMKSLESAIAFRNTFGAQILDILEDIRTAESEAELALATDELATTLERRADDLPASKTAGTGIWLWIVSTLLSVLMFLDDRQSNQQVLERLDGLNCQWPVENRLFWPRKTSS